MKFSLFHKLLIKIILNIIRNLKNLRGIHLEFNNISDLSPLRNLTNLELLILSRNPIKKEDIEELKKILPNCKIIYI
jgi:Leucine-rich repeat (LRR) protein